MEHNAMWPYIGPHLLFYILRKFLSVYMEQTTSTVLVIIKLTKFAAVLQLRCGSCKLIF